MTGLIYAHPDPAAVTAASTAPECVIVHSPPCPGDRLGQLVQSGRWDGMCDRRPFARPGRPSGVPRAVPFPARYDDTVSAQPAEREDPLDPQRILRELPGRERANFLAAYREALDGARDPAGWGNLRRVLRLWSGMVIAANRPGFYEAQEAALSGTGGGMLLEELGRLRPTGRAGTRRPGLAPRRTEGSSQDHSMTARTGTAGYRQQAVHRRRQARGAGRA